MTLGENGSRFCRLQEGVVDDLGVVDLDDDRLLHRVAPHVDVLGQDHDPGDVPLLSVANFVVRADLLGLLHHEGADAVVVASFEARFPASRSTWRTS